MNPSSIPESTHGNLMGEFLQGPGKPLARLWTALKDKVTKAAAQMNERKANQERAEQDAANRQTGHRGGSRPWPIRLLIPVPVAAEAWMAYVAVEALVSSVNLAVAFAILVALLSAGLAFAIAHQRLEGLPVPKTARMLEIALILIMFVLRFISLTLQNGDLLTAVGASALAALITALALYLIELVIVATETVGVFVAKVRAWHCRRQAHRAEHQHQHLLAQVERGRYRLEHHAVRFLVERGVSLDQADAKASELTKALDRQARPTGQEAH